MSKKYGGTGKPATLNFPLISKQHGPCAALCEVLGPHQNAAPRGTSTCAAEHAGTARFAFNWGLARKIEAYRKGKKFLPRLICIENSISSKKLNFLGCIAF